MIAAWSSWAPSPATALLALLIVGHVVADFLVQTRDDVEAKRRGRGFFAHGAAVFFTHLVVLAPLISVEVAGAVLAATLAHVVIDWMKSRLAPAGRELKPFALDQAAHVAVLIGAWCVLARAGAIPGYRWLSSSEMGVYVGGAVLAAAFVFNASGGSVIVAGILNLLPRHDGEDGTAGYAGAGRMIGILERTLMLAMVLYGEWAAIALLITAKSIARFEEIKVRKFAEYYLIGTLASLLVALVVGFALVEVLLPWMA
ncbi:MAG: DUF3307 domain-containing protein [Gemmatimonadota bacterium]